MRSQRLRGTAARLIGLTLTIVTLHSAGFAQIDSGQKEWTPPHPLGKSLFEFPPGSNPPVTPTYLRLQLDPGEMNVVEGEQGEGVAIRDILEGPTPGMIQHGVDAGEPDLGQRFVNVLLPYDADLSTITLHIEGVEHAFLGNFDLRPGGRPVAYDIETDESEMPLPEGVILDQDGRDIDIYDDDMFWPAPPVEIASTGQVGKYRFVRLVYSPYQWNPISRRLRTNDHLQLSITWEKEVLPLHQVRWQLSAALIDLSLIDWVNGFMIMEWYALQNHLQRNVEYDYIIITTRYVTMNSTMLSEFREHKESLGYRVITVSVESIEYWYSYDETSTSIREFLKEAYWAWGLTYCLLIGDPDPYDKSSSGDYVGSVPMKMTWLDGSWDTDKDYPTDFYYAELTGDWDGDGDGWVAEVEDDGVVEYGAELLVGRIPFEEVEVIDPILERTIIYEENSSSPPSRRNYALLGLSLSDVDTDGAYLGEQLLDDAFYAEGLYTETYYQSASTLPSYGVLIDGQIPFKWTGYDPGLVLWWGHGSTSGASVGYSGAWDGELMYTSSVGLLGDSDPAFVVQISCSNGKPETPDNITHELIKEHAVSAIAASRTSIYIGKKTSFGDDIDNGSIGYHICVNHAESDPAGVSMSLYRWELFEGDAGGGNWKSRNLMVYNLYGDPSLEFHY